MSRVWWNGRLVPEGEARIAATDEGLLFGDGLFETLRVDAGHAGDVDAHLDRLLAGLERIGLAIPEDRAELAAAVAAVAVEAPRPVARLRLTISRGAGGEPTRLVAARPYEPPGEELYRQGVAAVLLPGAWVLAQGPLAGLKTLSYQAHRLALRRAEELGAWEALLLNEHGRLAEGSRTNVAVVLGGKAWTPPLEEGCLPGITRRKLLERGELAERPLNPADLAAAEGILLLNSLIGALPVGRLDGRTVRVSPLAGRLQEAGRA